MPNDLVGGGFVSGRTADAQRKRSAVPLRRAAPIVPGRSQKHAVFAAMSATDADPLIESGNVHGLG